MRSRIDVLISAGRSRRLPAYVLCALAITLSACASRPRPDLANLPGTDACFWTANVRDWTVIDNTTLVVDAPGAGNVYLVKLIFPLPGLQYHEGLSLHARAGYGRICSNGASVSVGGSVPENRAIIAVRHLSAAEAARLRGHAPAPAAAPPAAVEHG
jgi:hypothetical protein